ncbi:hypothetical protein NDGK_01769 [Clostridiales bacterium CHKCI001]|nr:hypothetical protein NDGK_01769 [Clostridiales bacterium CHKCI001]
MEDVLNEFGKMLITEVRDWTIGSMNKMIDGTMKGTTAELIKKNISILDKEQIEVLKWLIPEIVDFSLDSMLFMFEGYPDLQLVFRGVDLKELSDGLSGELYTEDGWIQKFSEYDELISDEDC